MQKLTVGFSPEQREQLEESRKKNLEIARQRDETAVIQLPLWRDEKRGSPNSFLRSALFAAIQSKDRVFIKDALIFSQQGYTVKFTGEQLNQEDMKVWLALIDLAKLHPLGTECSFTAYSILKHIGLSVGGREHERLRICIERMTACMVKIENDRSIYGGNLVHTFNIDKDTKHYKVQLNRDLIRLFGENDWTAINWEQRKQLKNKPLSLKLHEYYSSHEYPKPVSFDFIYNVTASTNKDKYGFKRQVKAALNELVKINFLESYEVKEDKITVKRIIKSPVKRH